MKRIPFPSVAGSGRGQTIRILQRVVALAQSGAAVFLFIYLFIYLFM